MSQKLYDQTLHLSIDGLESKISQATKHANALTDLSALTISRSVDDLDELTTYAQSFQQFDNVLILGTGGSSLGGKTLYALAEQKKQKPHLHFLDNIDPTTFDDLFTHLELEKTGLIAISKSGTTAETLAQFLICLKRFSNQLAAHTLARHVIVITEPKESPLSSLAKQYGLPLLNHHTDIGGRFAVLSNVGLLPAAIAGLDIQKIRQGAVDVLDACLNTPNTSAPVIGAAAQAALLESGISQTVLMPYIDQLRLFTYWFRQLWAESLGKDGKGTTPINALGTVDQHSQLQLYLDGPQDKFFTFILKNTATTGDTISTDIPALSYLNNATMGKLLEAEQNAIVETLKRNKRPLRVMHVNQVNEQTLGQLFMHFMIETIIMANLLGVNAFDQPAVEQGKILTREYLQGAG